MWPIVYVNGCLIVILYMALASVNSVALKNQNNTALPDSVVSRTFQNVSSSTATIPLVFRISDNVSASLDSAPIKISQGITKAPGNSSVSMRPSSDTDLQDTHIQSRISRNGSLITTGARILRKPESVTSLADTVTLRSTPSINVAPVLRSSAVTTSVVVNTTSEITTEEPLIDSFKSLGGTGWCKMQLNGYDCKDKGTRLRYYFDLKAEDCLKGESGVCLNNYNEFDSEKDCRDTCLDTGTHEFKKRVTPKVYCTFQPDFGDCNDYYPKFYFDVTSRECKGFSYSGCGGNLNRFSTFQVCSAICMPLVEYKIEESKLAQLTT